MSFVRLFVAGALTVQSVVFARGAAEVLGATQAVLSLRQLLLAAPVGAVATHCRDDNSHAGIVSCKRDLLWRVGGAFVSVCEPPVPVAGDPRLARERDWHLTLRCRWGAPLNLSLTPLEFALKR